MLYYRLKDVQATGHPKEPWRQVLPEWTDGERILSGLSSMGPEIYGCHYFISFGEVFEKLAHAIYLETCAGFRSNVQ